MDANLVYSKLVSSLELDNYGQGSWLEAAGFETQILRDVSLRNWFLMLSPSNKD
jgi:hypothetical protein